MKVFCAVLVLGVLISRVISIHRHVITSDGKLRGAVMTNYDGGKFLGFTRIPFAKPPLGQLRFKLPEKNKPWFGILDATRKTPACTQPNPGNTAIIGQEDCLYLNIFTKSIHNYTLKPVLFFIHGGGFKDGTSTDYGPEFLLTEDIVLVTINYRLGVYGFMNTVNSDIASNAEVLANNGFKDQVLALKWVQRNIQYFGGNPKQVTLSGQSAGGMSVHAHILSPLSTGLFHQAILMSGSTLNIPMYAANDTAKPLANYLGLNTTNFDSMMQGFRKVSNEDLFKATQELKWFELQPNKPTLSGLVIEKPGAKSFLSDYPLNMLTNGNFKQIPLLVGDNNREGLFVYQPEKEINLDLHIPFYFHGKNEVMDKIRQFYNLDAIDGPLNLIDLYSDVWFNYPVFRAAREHVKLPQHKNTYFYQFAGDGKLNFLKSLRPFLKDLYGACHADELGYLFKSRGVPTAGSIEERLMRNMVKTWVNFVKNGKPVDNLETFQENAYNYFNIANSGLEISVLNDTSYKFWDELYNNYSNDFY